MIVVILITMSAILRQLVNKGEHTLWYRLMRSLFFVLRLIGCRWFLWSNASISKVPLSQRKCVPSSAIVSTPPRARVARLAETCVTCLAPEPPAITGRPFPRRSCAAFALPRVVVVAGGVGSVGGGVGTGVGSTVGGTDWGWTLVGRDAADAVLKFRETSRPLQLHQHRHDTGDNEILTLQCQKEPQSCLPSSNWP